MRYRKFTIKPCFGSDILALYIRFLGGFEPRGVRLHEDNTLLCDGQHHIQVVRRIHLY